jgi:hypothetical protein
MPSIVCTTKKMLFVAKWKIFESKRSFVSTLFASMDADADKKEAGNCKLLGRWMNPSDMTGWIVMETPTAEDAYKWLFNWTEEGCDVVLRPMADDNQVREIILGATPAYKVNHDSIGMEAPKGYSLFSMHGKMYPDKKDAAYAAFANMTEEQDKADPGNVKVLCRYHDMGMGEVFGVVAAKHETAVVDLNKWAVSAQRFPSSLPIVFPHHLFLFLSLVINRAAGKVFVRLPLHQLSLTWLPASSLRRSPVSTRSSLQSWQRLECNALLSLSYIPR